ICTFAHFPGARDYCRQAAPVAGYEQRQEVVGMERISEFMDGELDDHEAAAQLRRLKEEPELRAAWGAYHLIGDAMRGEAGYSSDLVARISARLASEPTVMAPRPPMQLRNVRRVALSAAASIG